MSDIREYNGHKIERHNVRKWTIVGDENEHRSFRSMALAKKFIDAQDKASKPAAPTKAKATAKAEPKTEPKAEAKAEAKAEVKTAKPAADTEYAVLMRSGTQVYRGTEKGTVQFLAEQRVQSAKKEALTQFKVQDLTLKADPHHQKDYLHKAVAAPKWAEERLSKAVLEEATKRLKTKSAETRKTKATKALSLTTGRSSKSTKQRDLPAGERFADEQIIATAGGKITYGMVRRIRAETAKFFAPGAPRGKVEAYRALAKELGLGMETVAKISRGNILEDIE